MDISFASREIHLDLKNATQRNDSFPERRVKEISAHDEFGNISNNLASISYSKDLFCSSERVVRCESNYVGRRADLVIEGDFATSYNVIVEAEIVNVSASKTVSIIYSNQQTVKFLQNPHRIELK
jgi:hypothetical protein